MDKWFLVYCKSMQESRAEENLTRQGFIVFRPTIDIVKNKIGCQTFLKRESLFPRYVFIKVDPDIRSIAPVLSTYGVVSFVKFGNLYATASDELIDEIKTSIIKQIALAGSRKAIEKGDEIYVDGHGFDQVKAIYCNPCGNMRAIILMNILGKESKLSVPMESISKITS